MYRIFAKEGINMSSARCMLRKCAQCKYEQKCFRENTVKKYNNDKLYKHQNKKNKKIEKST